MNDIVISKKLIFLHIQNISEKLGANTKDPIFYIKKLIGLLKMTSNGCMLLYR